MPPLVVVPETVTGKITPDEVIVLQPNPVPEVQVSAFEAPEHEGTARADGVVAVSAPRTVFAACEAMLVRARPVPDQLALLTVTVDPSAPAVTPVAGTAAAVIDVLQRTALDPPLVTHCSALAAVEQDGMLMPVGEADVPDAFARIVFADIDARTDSGIVPAPATVPENVGLARVLFESVCASPIMSNVSLAVSAGIEAL
jgi:hypothetical protein